MKKRLISIAIMLSMLLALFIFAPGVAVGENDPIDPPPLDDPPPLENQGPCCEYFGQVQKILALNTGGGNGNGNGGGGLMTSGSPLTLAQSVVSNTNPGDEPIDLMLWFINTGNLNIANIRVIVSGFTSEVMLHSGAFEQRIISPYPEGWIGPGGTAGAFFTIRVARSLSRDFQLGVDIIYDIVGGESNRTASIPGGATINIVRPEAPTPPPPGTGNQSVPRVIVSQHLISTDPVYVGQPFDLTLTLLNTSRNVNVRNMQVTITDPGGTFFPVIGVNSFFIERLDAQDTTEVTINLVAQPPANSDRISHAVTINIVYEDTRNNSHSTTPTVNIPVFTKTRLVTDNVVFEDDGNGTAFLMFETRNLGSAPLSNVSVSLVGPFMAENGNHFIGTLTPGGQDFYEDTIFVFEFGELHGEIVIEFEDTAGNPGELRVPISTFVFEPFIPEPDWGDDGRLPFPGDDMWLEEQPSSGLTWWQWALIIGGGIVVAGIAAIITVRTIKRKKREAEDFDDDFSDKDNGTDNNK